MQLIDAKNDRVELTRTTVEIDCQALRDADIDKVIYPGDGEPWIEREPFAGREQNADELAMADTILADAEAQAEPEEPTLDDIKAAKAREIEADRKAAEDDGVTVNDVRYAGNPSNRQALREALEYADDAERETFTRWKTSDDEFITDHPVADVRSAYERIGARRSELIDREGALLAEIETAEDRETVEGITWTSAD